MTTVEQHRQKLANRLGDPRRLTFPDGWKLSSSWRRAQAAPSTVGPANAAEFDVLLGYENKDGFGKHRVLFTIYEGDLVAECRCDGYRFRDWCAHVAVLWWRWSQQNLAVTDLDTGRNHLSPPWWLSIEDHEHGRSDVETSQPVAADGGEQQ